MFLRCKKHRKDGKEHLYWSVVERSEAEIDCRRQPEG
jgi:hypothetical protein